MQVKGVTPIVDYTIEQKVNTDTVKIQPDTQKGLEESVEDADNITKDLRFDRNGLGKEQKDNGLSTEDEAELKKSIEKMNKMLGIFNKKFEMQIHQETKRVMVKMINSDTGEIVSEYPPKKILDMLAQMQDMMGLIVDKKV